MHSFTLIHSSNFSSFFLFHPLLFLSFYPLFHQLIHPYIHPSIHLPFIHLSAHSLTHLPTCQLIHPPGHPAIHPLPHSSVHLPIHLPSTHSSVHLPIYHIYPPIYLFIHPSIYLIGTKSLLCTRYSAECWRFRNDEQGPSPRGGQNQLMRETDNRPLNKEMS